MMRNLQKCLHLKKINSNTLKLKKKIAKDRLTMVNNSNNLFKEHPPGLNNKKTWVDYPKYAVGDSINYI